MKTLTIKPRFIAVISLVVANEWWSPATVLRTPIAIEAVKFRLKI